MPDDAIVYTIFLIFTGAAVFATLALFARQALLVAYILLGVLFGPWCLGLVTDPAVIRNISDIGIIFLLFLLGLNLQPQDLVHLVRKTTLVTLGSSLVFFLIAASLALFFGYNLTEVLLLGAVATFSSTIIGLKLLPTTVLHHQRMGEIIISVLLLQDLIAIVLLLVLGASGGGGLPVFRLILLIASLPAMVVFALVVERWLLTPLIRRFDTIREYVFLLAIGWCLGLAELARAVGLSHEIGAFIAGISLASGPVAIFVAESLKPLRDFFLVMFFFSIGAGFDISMLEKVLFPAVLIGGLLLAAKPLVFRWLLGRTGENAATGFEIGFRLGQMSEFSLLVAVLALEQGVIGRDAAYLIQVSTVLTFLVSTYVIVLRYPTPIAVSEALRRD